MRYIVTLSFVVPIVVPAVVGCSPATLDGDFSSVDMPEEEAGEVSPDNVRVFVDRSPAGFSRLEGEPMVEAGFEHVVLGRVRVTHGTGRCDVGPRLTRQAVLAALRQRAAEAGGNAIVYAHSRIRDEMSLGELCRLSDVDTHGYGWGWAVRMHVAAEDAAAVEEEVAAEEVAEAEAEAEGEQTPAEISDADGDASDDDGAAADAAEEAAEATGTQAPTAGEEADAVSEETASDDGSEEEPA